MAEIYGTTESYLESMQTTSLYEHNSLKSNEINRLVESIGVGKNYIASNFDLSFVVSNDASPILSGSSCQSSYGSNPSIRSYQTPEGAYPCIPGERR